MQRKQSEKKINKNLSKVKIGIVVARYNGDITFAMSDAAIITLTRAGVTLKNIIVEEVPGSFEIPIVCQKLLKTKKLDGIIAIGCVIKGETDHYYQISNESTRGIMDVMLKFNVPISNAILTVNTLKQAEERSQGEMNKGTEAAKALLELL